MLKKLVLTAASFWLFSLSVAHAQTFSPRRSWDGPFDIRMIAAPNLQPVFIDKTLATATNKSIRAESVVSYTTLLMTYDLMAINNQYANNFLGDFQIPQQALLCKDSINGCGTLGLTPRALNGTCPTERYENPVMVTKTAAMSYADYDVETTTFSSSMAQLDISDCSEIESAYLYWSGNFRGSNPALTLVDGPISTYSGSGNVFDVNASSGYKTVLLKIPGSNTYQSVTAAAEYKNDRTYVCVSDVTNQVRGLTGGGQFWVANLQSYPLADDGGSTSGWNLVVVFRSPLSPPRLITLYDGFECVNGNQPSTACPASTKVVLTGLQTPATSDFRSYIGFAALDGEDIAAELAPADAREGLGFQTTNTVSNTNGPIATIQPFLDDQPPYKLFSKKGYPAKCDGSDNINEDCKIPLYDANWCSAYDGIGSSKITTYDEVTKKNGNEIVRLPSGKNTLGVDAHHMILPENAIIPSANQATLFLRGGKQGGMNAYMAYIAIEKLQPKLILKKKADQDQTTTGVPRTYTLTIVNAGNQDSFGGDILLDTLDPVTKYAGSLVSTKYTNGATSAGGVAAPVVTATSSGQELKFTIPVITKKDSLTIRFNVDVLPVTDPVAGPLYTNQCKRTILNTGWIDYKKNILSERIKSKSNSGECNDGSEVRILITGLGNAPTALADVDASAFRDDFVVKHVRKQIFSQGHASADDTASYVVYDTDGNRIYFNDKFPTTGNDVTYIAYRDLSGATCQDVVSVKFTFGDFPKFVIDTVNVSCFGLNDGKINVVGSFTKPASQIAYYFLNGNITTGAQFNAATKVATKTMSTVLDWEIPNLSPGDYTIVAEDQTGLLYFLGYKVTQPAVITGTLTATLVCAGEASTVTLSNVTGGLAGQTPAYAWQQSADSTSNSWTAYTGTVTGTSISPSITQKTYFRVITTIGVCKDTVATGVTVKSVPIAAIDPTPTVTICTGGTATLKASPAGASYLWSNNETTESIQVGAGEYTVEVTFNGCKATSPKTTVSVSNPPKPAIVVKGANPFCEGDSVVLKTSGGTIYNWSDGTSVVGTADSLIVRIGGTFSVEVGTSATCKNSSDGVTVTVNPLPVATIVPNGPISFCQGGSVQLDANPSGANAYAWSNGTAGNNITVNTSGRFAVEVTDVNGCKDVSDSITTIVNPLPVPVIVADGPIDFCQGDSVHLKASPVGKYVWSTSDTTENVTILTSGSYTVEVTDANNCKATSAATVVTVTPAPDAPITTDQYYCVGATANPLSDAVQTVSGVTFTFYDENNVMVPSTTVPNTSTPNLPAGAEYYVIGIGSTNCPSPTSSFKFAVDNAPTGGVVSGNLSLCEGDTGNYLVDQVQSLLPLSYTWSTGTQGATLKTSIDSIATYSFNGNGGTTTQGDFSVEVSNKCGNITLPYSVTIRLKPQDNPNVITGTLVFCENAVSQDYTIASQADATTYNWTWEGDPQTSTTSMVTILKNQWLGGTKPIVTVTPENACGLGTTKQLEVEVVKAKQLEVSISADKPIFCQPTDIVTFKASVKNADPSVLFTFSIDNGVVATQIADSSFVSTLGQLNDRSEVKVKVEVTGCYVSSSAEASTIVTGYDLPLSNVIAVNGKLVICEEGDSPIVLRASPVAPGKPITYEWRNQTGSVVSGSELTLNSPSQSGLYTLIAKNGVCPDFKKDTVVRIYEMPAITFAHNPLLVKYENPEQQVKIVVTGTGLQLDTLSGIDWYPGTWLSNTDVLEPYFLPKREEQTFSYLLSVATGGGVCTKQFPYTIVNYLELFIPNAFSPNNDGKNDVWVIDGMGKYPQSKVNVFNRWGNKMYVDNDGYKVPWDGSNNGADVASGTYYYVIDLKGSPDNTDRSVTGSLTIVK